MQEQQQQRRIISGITEEEIGRQLTADLSGGEDLVYYEVEIEQAGYSTLLIIDIDLGGGFESGYATTGFTAPVEVPDEYKLSIHKEGFLDKAGKLFGMQDVVLGYPSFDEVCIVKTNNEEKTKNLFSDEEIRTILLSLPQFLLHIGHKEVDEIRRAYLELTIEEGVTDPVLLNKIYPAFFGLLKALGSSNIPSSDVVNPVLPLENGLKLDNTRDSNNL